MRAFWTGEPVGCALPLESGRKGRLLRPFATETRSDPVVESGTGDRRRSSLLERRHLCLKSLQSLI